MTTSELGPPAGDITVRDLLSSLTALQVLPMVMTDSKDEDEILDLAVAALPSLSHQCRAEAIWLDGEWRSVDCLRGRVGPRADLEGQLARLGGTGGLLQSRGLGWAWAFPLASRGGPSGYLVVGSPGPPPEHERSLIQGLAQQTGAALANTRLLGQERATRTRISDEQATFRRVATLVAGTAPPEEVFAGVAAEAGQLLDADFSVMSRYDAGGTATVVGAWTPGGTAQPLPPGSRLELRGKTVHTLVFQTGRPARIDDYGHDSGVGADIASRWGVSSVVGVPISLEGRLWGQIGVASTRKESLPADTETWLGGFVELVSTAIANAQARVELREFAEEEAALRRVATLVAQGAPAEDEVFAAVAAEAGKLLKADYTVLSRYDSDGLVTVVGGWARSDSGRPLAVGLRLEPTGRNIHALVFETHRQARLENYGDASGAFADTARDWGFRSSVGVPISVGGQLWGVMIVGSTGEEPLPADTETRLAGFTELIGTALANAEAQVALTASRVRIVVAADTARRRIERDLHDGAQQRLVSLALELRHAQGLVPPEADELSRQLDGVVDQLTSVLAELREIARGIHPAVLAEGGLSPALKTLARRSAVPVGLDVRVEGRLPEPIELAVYYVVAEALTNAAKHADATVIDVEVAADSDRLRVGVRDDGRGGADVGRGSGLVGLTDRVGTLGGRLWLRSPPGEGTHLQIELPLDAPSSRGSLLP
jgi:signal transduction histidine kinase